METNKNSKKIIIFGVILLMLAGLIVVALKGFKVSLMFGKHETIEIKLDKAMDFETMEQISKDVFQKKDFTLKELEVFGDSAQINVEAITDEEKTTLINQINEKFEVSKTVEDLKIYSVSNKRIRDVVKPYIVPMISAFAVIFIYVLIRFRKINGIQLILEFVKTAILTEVILLSVIAVTRFPVTDGLIAILMLIPILELIIATFKGEEKLAIENNE